MNQKRVSKNFLCIKLTFKNFSWRWKTSIYLTQARSRLLKLLQFRDTQYKSSSRSTWQKQSWLEIQIRFEFDLSQSNSSSLNTKPQIPIFPLVCTFSFCDYSFPNFCRFFKFAVPYRARCWCNICPTKENRICKNMSKNRYFKRKLKPLNVTTGLKNIPKG